MSKIQKGEKMKKAFALKYGSYASATVAIVIAVVLALNIVLNIFNEKYPMTVDLTTAQEFTIDEENIEFLKSIDYKVDITVVFTQEQYSDAYYMAQTRGIYDETGKYLAQSVGLLEQYKKYNSNITVSFLDPWGSESSTLVQKFTESDIDFTFGDILLECYPDGEDAKAKLGVVSAEDCYTLASDSDATLEYYNTGAETKTITANEIEQAVANGIFKTVNLETVKVAFIATNSDDSYDDNLEEIAHLNAYEIEPTNMILDTDFSKYDVMMICAPSADYTKQECDVIADWLDNDGKKGKTLVYLPSSASPELPNLHALLEEWGIGYKTGYKYYSNNEFYYNNENTNIYLETLNTDYTASVDAYSGGNVYVANNMIPMEALYEEELGGTRTVTTIIQTKDYEVYKKPDNESSWKPSGAGDWGAAAMVSKDAGEEDASYVVGFSSVDFIANHDTVTKGENSNLKAFINVLNTTARSSEDVYVMPSKLVSDNSGVFVKSTTQAQKNIILVVFVIVIPLSLIAWAVFVYLRRKNL